MKLYSIILIHRLHDWDASFKFQAPNARTARRWALAKLAMPGDWLVVKARVTTAKDLAS